MENSQITNPLIDKDFAKKVTFADKAPEVAAPQVELYTPKGPDKSGFYWGTGRRKSSIARVRIKPGEGKIVINDREFDSYFNRPEHKSAVEAPLKAVDGMGKYDVFVNVQGGGETGQSGAIMLGLARALRDVDIANLNILRQTGYLTRDGRMKERKKYGQRGARRRYQFSKR